MANINNHRNALNNVINTHKSHVHSRGKRQEFEMRVCADCEEIETNPSITNPTQQYKVTVHDPKSKGK